MILTYLQHTTQGAQGSGIHIHICTIGELPEARVPLLDDMVEAHCYFETTGE